MDFKIFPGSKWRLRSNLRSLYPRLYPRLCRRSQAPNSRFLIVPHIGQPGASQVLPSPFRRIFTFWVSLMVLCWTDIIIELGTKGPVVEIQTARQRAGKPNPFLCYQP